MAWNLLLLRAFKQLCLGNVPSLGDLDICVSALGLLLRAVWLIEKWHSSLMNVAMCVLAWNLPLAGAVWQSFLIDPDMESCV